MSYPVPTTLRGNGHAEGAVQTAKCVLKQEDPLLALMCYRARSMTSTGISPAEVFMGWKIRTPLPSLKRNLVPKHPGKALIRHKDAEAEQQQTTGDMEYLPSNTGTLETTVKPDIYLDCFSSINLHQLTSTISSSKSSTCLLDPIPTRLLKEVLPLVSTTLLDMINLSLLTGHTPVL